jgi:hypothetical protein
MASKQDWYAEQIELGYRVQTAMGRENWPGVPALDDIAPVDAFRMAEIEERAGMTTP